MNEKEFLKTKDAAEYIGVSHKTMLRYAKEGLVSFKYGRSRGSKTPTLFDKESLDALAPRLTEVRDLEAAVERYKGELRSEEKALKEHIKELRREYSSTKSMWMRSGALLKTISATMSTIFLLGGDLAKSRQKSIVMDILGGMTMDEVAQKNGVSRELVRVNLLKTLKRVKEDIPGRIEERISDLENENANLRKTIENLLADNERIRLSVIKKKGVTPEVLQSTVYSRNVRDLHLSVRAGNCVRAIGCETIGDVCSFKEHELMAIHSFGVRSLEDVKSQLAELGLALGTTPRRPHLSQFYL